MICCNYRTARLCGCYGCEAGRHCAIATSSSLRIRLLARFRAWWHALDWNNREE